MWRTNGAPVAPRVIPRLHEMVDQNYPGTRIAITEYNWGALTISTARSPRLICWAFSDVKDWMWLPCAGPPKPTDPGAFAFQDLSQLRWHRRDVRRTSVQASSVDQGKLSYMGRCARDRNLTAVVINKTSNDLSSTAQLANFSAGPAAKVWSYSAARLDAIVMQPDAPVGWQRDRHRVSGQFHYPADYPPASLPVPKPGGGGGAQRRLLHQAIAPGQMVVIFGAAMGPDKLAFLRQEEKRTGKQHDRRRSYSL